MQRQRKNTKTVNELTFTVLLPPQSWRDYTLNRPLWGDEARREA